MTKSAPASRDNFAKLRREAEEIARRQPAELKKLSREEMQRVVHELQVHQIELEMQNDELRRTQAELEDARDRYRDLYDFAPVGYLTLSDKNIVLEANLTAATMLGVDRAHLVKKPLTRFITRNTQDAFYLFRKPILDTQMRQVCELKMVKADQSEFDAAPEAIAAQGTDGASILRVSLSDITTRKRAEAILADHSKQLEQMVEERTRELRDAHEQLLRQERLAVLGQIVGGISHELRSPLGGIKNAAWLLNHSLSAPDPDAKETLEILNRQVENANRIITSLMDYASPKPPYRRETDLRGIIDAALAYCGVPARVVVNKQYTETLPALMADPDQLDIVFCNLIRNAVQAMPDGGQLTVRAEGRNQKDETLGETFILVSVADTGVGIAPDILDKIFLPLFSTKSSGMGLGLALCKLLVEGHGGKIQVTSQVGKGATFAVNLPCGVEQSNPPRAQN
jgi:PAS domain S-box-containing protein